MYQHEYTNLIPICNAIYCSRSFQKEWQQTIVVFYKSPLGWNLYPLHSPRTSQERLRRNNRTQHVTRDPEEREDSIWDHPFWKCCFTEPFQKNWFQRIYNSEFYIALVSVVGIHYLFYIINKLLILIMHHTFSPDFHFSFIFLHTKW